MNPHWTISHAPKDNIEHCKTGCIAAGAGYPFAYVVDKNYLSPVGSADIAGAIFGVDRIVWPKFFASLVFGFGVLGSPK